MKDRVEDRPVRMVFSHRRGGFSAAPYDSFNLGDHVGDSPEAVQDNREKLRRAVGADHLVFMEQIHSPTVTEVVEEHVHQGTVETTDAMITTLRGVGLVVLTADCVPVLLSDADAGVIAAVHAGRMGARNGIVSRVVHRMEELGAVPGNIHALMGAAICGKDYEVPQEMAQDVEKKLPGAAVTTSKGTPGLDIRAGITRQLLSLGVRSIDADPRCTFEEKDFFSYRREGKTGRQASVIWMP